MEREVYLIVYGEDYFLGSVDELLTIDNEQPQLRNVVREIVDNLVFSDDSSNYAVCSIEVR